jgi:hypothetical protein
MFETYQRPAQDFAFKISSCPVHVYVAIEHFKPDAKHFILERRRVFRVLAVAMIYPASSRCL